MVFLSGLILLLLLAEPGAISAQDKYLVRTFTGHADRVNSVCLDPEGKYIISGSKDRTLKLWDISGKLRKTFEGHSDSVNSVCFSPDGKFIASGSSDKSVRLWGADGKPVRSMEAHKDSVMSVSFSPDSKYIASSSRDSTVKLWYINGNLESSAEAHIPYALSASFSPDRNYLVTAGYDRTLKLWNIQEKLLRPVLMKPFYGPLNYVNTACFSPDSLYIASAGGDNFITLWDLKGNSLRTFKGHDDSVNSLFFSPDGKYLISGSNDGTIRIWDIEGKLPGLVLGTHQGPVLSVSISADSGKIASSGSDKTVRLWDSRKLLNRISEIRALMKGGDEASVFHLAGNGTDPVDFIADYGIEALRIMNQYGMDSFEQIKKYGKEAVPLFDVYGTEAKALLNRYGSRIKEEIAKNLKKPGSSGITNDIKYLSRTGFTKANPDLINLLRSRNREIAGTSAEALVRLGEKRAVPALNNYLNTVLKETNLRPGEEKAGQIIGFLSRAGDWETTRTLMRFLNKGLYPVHAVSGLLEINDNSGLPVLFDNMQYISTNDLVKLTAMADKKGSMKYLLPAMDHKNETARVFSIRTVNTFSLGSTNRMRTERKYREILAGDASGQARSLAAEGLGLFGSWDSVRILTAAFGKDISEEVKLSCAAALLALRQDRKGEYLGFIRQLSLRTNDHRLSRKADVLLKNEASRKKRK
ncbi:MAG: hypothetical protein PHF84_11960 [bacterium]|nr:hypothetical protein [bacterium]